MDDGCCKQPTQLEVDVPHPWHSRAGHGTSCCPLYVGACLGQREQEGQTERKDILQYQSKLYVKNYLFTIAVHSLSLSPSVCMCAGSVSISAQEPSISAAVGGRLRQKYPRVRPGGVATHLLQEKLWCL